MGSDKYLIIDYLIVGAGPAGASLAAFMGQNGLTGMVISRAPSTADTPRAHLTNPFAIETLRDLGLEKDAVAHATQGEMFQSFRWTRSILGEEYGKVEAWGASSRLGDLAAASPCMYYDLPQSYLEPILVRYASTHGFHFRFSTQLIAIEDVGNGDSLCTIRDLVSKNEFQIRAKYVFGADGAHSKVADLIGISYQDDKAQGNVACNILFKADIEHLMSRERFAGLHIIIQPDRFIGMVPVMRLIRPWNQWILIVAFGKNKTLEDMSTKSPELIQMIHHCIGDDSIEVEIQKLDPWTVKEVVANTYSVKGKNAFILGDAAHRHPPSHGNGSNTCIQDAYNLAWKVAYVAKGLAGPKLLESYTIERQPVGATLVRESNIQFAGHVDVWTALGQFETTAEGGLKAIAELSETTPAGDKRRQQLHDALEGKRQECENLGLAMNQWYDSSAVYLDDETGLRPTPSGDPVVEIVISTYPGNRLPHAWLDGASRKKLISTQDLAGRGSFCLLIGHKGQAWRKAADNISKATGIPINTYGIGFRLDYIDVYRDWYKRREVEEDGCVLVRPDRFIAWRSKTMEPSSDCEGKLRKVLDRVLSRDGLQSNSYRVSA
ncbi:FAD binding domain-containing protein [Xylaria nigripes]|nr:FAD binding domain-containing protein [Xylaria nigripes]